MASTLNDRLKGVSTTAGVKVPVRMASTGNLVLVGLQTVDGVVGAEDDRVLVKNQTDTSQNGIYLMRSSAWVRTADFSGARDIVQGTIIRVVNGSVHGDQWWQVATAVPVIGSALTFTQVSDTQLGGFRVVRDWGIVGSGDETALIITAVAAAYAGGFELYWPAGAYTTTASIPNLHDVKHTGSGRIVRGLDTFYLNPRYGDSNTLYIAPTATSGNDGLSASQPIGINTDDWARIENALANYGPTLMGQWTIQGAAGTYKGGLVQPRNLNTMGTIIDYKGPARGHPNVPTMIVDQATGPAETRGMLFQDNAIIRLTDIMFTGGFAECVSATRACYLWLVNTHYGPDGASAYPTICVATETHTHYFVAGGAISGSKSGPATIGFSELFSVVRSFSTGVTASSQQMTISGCAIGVKAKENCTGHLRYLNIDDCATGVELQLHSGANVSQMEIDNCNVGIVTTNSELHGTDGIVWGAGNTIKILPFGQASSILDDLSWDANDGNPPFRVGYPAPVLVANDYDSDTHTGTTNITAIVTWLDLLRAGHYSAKGRSFEVHVAGRIPAAVTLAGDVTIYLYVEGLQEASVVIPAGAATQGWTAKFKCVCTADGNSQVYSATLVGTTFQYGYTIRRTRDLASQDNAVAVRVGLANAADSITLDTKEVYA